MGIYQGDSIYNNGGGGGGGGGGGSWLDITNDATMIDWNSNLNYLRRFVLVNDFNLFFSVKVLNSPGNNYNKLFKILSPDIEFISDIYINGCPCMRNGSYGRMDYGFNDGGETSITATNNFNESGSSYAAQHDFDPKQIDVCVLSSGVTNFMCFIIGGMVPIKRS